MGKARHPHDSRRPESAAVKLGVEIFREEGNIEPLRHALTPRQRAFCEEYVIDFNAAAAAVRAGYSPNFVDRQAYTLKQNEGVSAYIDYLQMVKTDRTTIINPDYVIARVTEIISGSGTKDGDKLRGLELLARHLGMLTDRTESKVTVETVEKQKVEEDANDFISQLKAMKKSDSTKKDVEIL